MKAKLIKVDDVYRLFEVTKHGNSIIGTTDLDYQKSWSDRCQKLSLKNCQAIERGYDLDNCVDYFEKGKLYIQQDGVIILAGENGNNGIIIQDPLKTRGVGHYSDEWNPKAFCECSQKALELMGDKKFSEEDMEKAIELALETELKTVGYDPRPFTSNKYSKKQIIQSLQQTEWDVDFEMEYHPTFKIPKLDENGCLILKRV